MSHKAAGDPELICGGLVISEMLVELFDLVYMHVEIKLMFLGTGVMLLLSRS